MREYFRIAFDRFPIGVDTRKRSTRIIQKALSLPARWRLDHDVYRFPAELWVNNRLNRKKSDFKPVVDAKRLETATSEAAC
jgi:hypothetical protein